ncbi:hypothetical protein BKP35_16365 [Anaerobacillus arseniciselenatis]|uniref:Uncharacterized protein n=1 Tax=Anaerobacillus arseniciselenatis TaxID=85682 RepID=A0A1S2LCH6_9BACI|nr:hypothetical protein [Anaerobacillus arseniciselenatis]OIJ09427.1 hypothetical protein BKP35_16365 [Anaerobacillus arseniciselenatis]
MNNLIKQILLLCIISILVSCNSEISNQNTAKTNNTPTFNTIDSALENYAKVESIKVTMLLLYTSLDEKLVVSKHNNNDIYTIGEIVKTDNNKFFIRRITPYSSLDIGGKLNLITHKENKYEVKFSKKIDSNKHYIPVAGSDFYLKLTLDSTPQQNAIKHYEVILNSNK